MIRCPKCGLPANDVEGDPFTSGAAGLPGISILHVNCHCDGGHSWAEIARYSPGGGVVSRTTEITWALK